MISIHDARASMVHQLAKYGKTVADVEAWQFDLADSVDGEMVLVTAEVAGHTLMSAFDWPYGLPSDIEKTIPQPAAERSLKWRQELKHP
jgi:hypothetical protein